ncbi:MAG: PHP domain-containing protein [Zhenhengia sp.]
MDYHIHTQFSDGEADYKEVIDLSIERKLKSIAITDHFDPFDKTLRNKDASMKTFMSILIVLRCMQRIKRLKFYVALKHVQISRGI